jgi:hypothetical protein
MNKLVVTISRMIGAALIISAVITVPVFVGSEPSAVVFVVGLSAWSYVIGYLDRGWTEYLKQIGEL